MWFPSCFEVAAGAVAGTPIQTSNITITEGNEASLRCDLPAAGTNIVQVTWDRCDGADIAYHITDKGHVVETFAHRVTLAEGYGIKIHSAYRNDSGPYCCTFATFPNGKMVGKIFLLVREPTEWNVFHYIVTGLIPGILLLLFGGAVTVFWRKKKSQQSQNISNQQIYSQSPAGQMAPHQVPNTSQERENNTETEYFNVLLFTKPTYGPGV
ncbi:hypothetical protein XENTR_v10004717 [Xenopus tropicalis]|nr:hypothetical protein XENTR_v10004717 [Xenopus tropicalis]